MKLLIPSSDLKLRIRVSPNEFLERLNKYVEPRKPGSILRVERDFEGEIHEDGRFDLKYWKRPLWVGELSNWQGGPRLTGKVLPSQEGAEILLKIKLPERVLAFGLTFAWGTFIIGLTGIIAMASNIPPRPSITKFLVQLAIVSIPALISYNIMFGNLRHYIKTISGFFDENFKTEINTDA